MEEKKKHYGVLGEYKTKQEDIVVDYIVRMRDDYFIALFRCMF